MRYCVFVYILRGMMVSFNTLRKFKNMCRMKKAILRAAGRRHRTNLLLVVHLGVLGTVLLLSCRLLLLPLLRLLHVDHVTANDTDKLMIRSG